MTGRIQNRIALVTGGSSGLGRAICLKLASEGAKICCVDLYESPRNQTNPETGKADDFNNRIEGESTCAEIFMSYGEKRAVFVKADVTKVADIEAAVARCVEVFGRVSSTNAFSTIALMLTFTTAGYNVLQRRHLSRINAPATPRNPRNERRRLG
jgi:NAD(P)-dependent dehydrogenase (short-subunit alcohol dehydrogenase family)